jgi:hypothetical protein
MATITFNDEIYDESYEKFEQKMNEALEKEQDLTIYIYVLMVESFVYLKI